jgi:HTH-type transcriptional regulator / antitoxin HigA
MSEEEYWQSLARIGELMDARPGTLEFVELGRLVWQVETYENEHYPIPEPSAADAARFRAEQEEAV